MTSPVRRSKEMITVAYFLSRYGEPVASGPARPPRELATPSWGHAYAIFYRALNAGRTVSAFHNSLKNARDQFDSHLASGRVGWRDPSAGRPPAPLSPLYAQALANWGSQPREAIWAVVRNFADLDVAFVPGIVLADIEAFESAAADRQTKTEGGRRVYVSGRAERDPSLRAAAIRIHGTSCCVCGFDYARVYGEWGAGFAEVHHIVALGGAEAVIRETDPATDLAIVCANCHRMLHRRRSSVLSVEELKHRFNRDGLAQWAREPEFRNSSGE